MGSQVLPAAEVARVAAGGALAVDRDAFSAEVTRMVESCENITVHREQVETIDESCPHPCGYRPIDRRCTGRRDRPPDRRRAAAFLRCRGPHRHRRKSGLQQGVRRFPV